MLMSSKLEITTYKVEKKMKRIISLLLVLAVALSFVACNRGEGGAAGYGAGGGQSLREGSTSPLHSPIAQDETYQKLLGLNIILYPPPVDDPKFEPYGAAYWDLDATEFVEAMRGAFDGEMGDRPVYEPQVEALQDLPLVQQISETIYNGEPVQVGWIYGNNAVLEYLELNDVTVTLISAENIVIFVGDESNLDPSMWQFDVKKAKAFYIPANAVVALNPRVLHSAPLRVSREAGALTAVIVPQGVGLGAASAGEGIDQALVAEGRWIFAFEGVDGFYAGLTGSPITINPVD